MRIMVKENGDVYKVMVSSLLPKVSDACTLLLSKVEAPA